ncbi:MAG: formimidoylglutamase [Ignavibacteriaceae bacterium]|jgi:formiminoglutamase
MNIFNLTTRPDTSLFYKRNDPEDIRLGEKVHSKTEDYIEADVVILGSPQDEGVIRNKGREGAKYAPDKIRESFYKLTVSEKIESIKLFDLGNVKIEKNLEDIHNMQEEVIFKLLSDNKKVIILGGGNDISYPDCKALSRFNNNPLVFNIDSHFDVRPDKPRNSGTSYRMLLDENLVKPKNFYEIGIKLHSSASAHKNYLERKGSHIFYYDKIPGKKIKKVLKEILLNKKNKVLFWGFDIDSIKESDAPGVSAPNPVGFSIEEALLIAETAGSDKRTKIFEISEVNPKFDIDNKTCRLAALIMWQFLNKLN